MADTFALFHVYSDGDSTPYLVRNPPPNFEELLEEYNRLDRLPGDEQPAAMHGGCGTWLRSKGVTFAPLDRQYYLDDYQPEDAE